MLSVSMHKTDAMCLQQDSSDCYLRAAPRVLMRFIGEKFPNRDIANRLSIGVMDLATHQKVPGARLRKHLFLGLTPRQRKDIGRILQSGIAETLNFSRERVTVRQRTGELYTVAEMHFQFYTNEAARGLLKKVLSELAEFEKSLPEA